MDVNLTTILVAAASGGGGVLIVREVIGGLIKLAGGVAGKVNKRQTDIVAERDSALDRAEAAELKADRELRNRQRGDVYAAKLERLLAVNGIPIDPVTTPPPVFEETIGPDELRRIKRAGK